MKFLTRQVLDSDFLESNMRMTPRKEARESKMDFASVLQNKNKGPDEFAAQKIKRAAKVFHLVLAKIKFCSIAVKSKVDPVHGIDPEMSSFHDALVCRRSIFFGIIVNTIEVNASQSMVKASAFIHPSTNTPVFVADRKQRFTNLFSLFMESGFTDRIGKNIKILDWEFIHFVYSLIPLLAVEFVICFWKMKKIIN